MMSQKNIFSLLAVSVSALSLSACAIGSSMPSGYTHHHKEYKSADPAPSSRVSDNQRQYMDATQAEQFRTAVYDLLQRMTQRAGFPPKPAYVLAPNPSTVFYNNIDNDLRESMRALGYSLSDTPVDSYVFAYDAMDIEGTDMGQPNVQLTLKVFDSATPDARQLTEETGTYYIQGAETLNIKPSKYSNLPSYQRIQAQMDGFTPYEPVDRTATGQLNTNLSAPTMDMGGNYKTSDYNAPAKVDYPPLMPTEPMYEIESSSEPAGVVSQNQGDFYIEPTQGVEIDSGSVSYAEPMEDYTPTPNVMRPRVSKKIEY